jgi:dolichyl-phosphate beta-glucosyltransferase
VIDTLPPLPQRLSVVIPAYNEDRRIPETLEALQRYAAGRFEAVEILVVDDGSSDGTADVARAFAARAASPVSVRVLSNGKNLGKGASVRSGMLAASEDWILMTDADLSTPIEDLPALYAALTDGGADVALGSRALAESRLEVRQPLYREFMGRTFNRMVQLLLLGGIRDTQCGFKLFKREAARAIFSRAKVDRFAFDVEAVFLAQKLGLTVVEIPVTWRNSPHSTVSPLRDSAQMFFDIVRIRRLHP